MADFALFWGCQIPARLPFVEKSTRLVLDQLGVSYREIPGFTCCPERELVRTANEELWFTTAARNLALAEGQDLDILTPCNGCYSTLKDVLCQIKLNPYLLATVNDVLDNFGLEYQGRVRVKHLVEFFHDDLGPYAIQEQVQAPLAGMKVAVHYGCHLLRPYPAINFDDPLHPVKFDALIQALGARSVNYETKMLCCGQAFNAVDEPGRSGALAGQKLQELQQLGVKALITSCPMCYIQYDYRQAIMRRQGEEVHIPVFYITELMALVMGVEASELGLDLHRTDVSPFFVEWERARRRLSFAQEHFDLTLVEKCYSCAGCLKDCPSVKAEPSWNPNQIMGRILAGEVEELLASKEIWQCLGCYTCDEMCPQEWGMRQAFETLKHLALTRGVVPRGTRNALDGFRKTGKMIEAAASARAQRSRLGLPDLFADSGEEIQQVLEAAEGTRIKLN